MKFQKEDIIEIVEKAVSLYDRLDGGWVGVSGNDNERKIAERLEELTKNIADGNGEKLKFRFEWDKLNLGEIRDYLGDVRLANPDQLPEWAEVLKEVPGVLERIVSGEITIPEYKTEDDPSAENKIPFVELLYTFVYIGEERLKKIVGADYCLLSEQARLKLGLNLLGVLFSRFSEVLLFEFDNYKMTRNFQIDFNGGMFFGNLPFESDTLYREFIKEMSAGKIIEFFKEYSIVPRLAAVLVQLWVESGAEFIKRLAADLEELERKFAGGAKIGKVKTVIPGLSDPHNRFRMVMILIFESGLKLVYKPKDLGLEQSYSEFIDYLNSLSISLDFKTIKVLAKDDYGWVEFIEHKPCAGKEEVRDFYKRSGMLLALLYALEATDCNYENIIASGPYPALIDMETLFHHQPVVLRDADGINTDARFLAGDQLWDSVLRTFYLPKWEFGVNGESFDISGMGGGDPGRQTSFIRPAWKNINTDNMRVVYEKILSGRGKNRPILDGEAIAHNDYVTEFLEGFTEMYRVFIKYRDRILKDGGPLERFKGKQVRFVFRHTKIYYVLQKKSFEINFLKDGITRSIALEALSRAMVKYEQKPYFFGLLKKELEAMERADVPYFYSLTTSRDIYTAGEKVVEGYFDTTSFDNVVKRINSFNDQDLEKQISIIKGALYSKIVADSHQVEESSPRFEQVYEGEIPKFTKELAAEKALEIADELMKKAVFSPDGACSWIGLNYSTAINQYLLEPLGYSYYDGVSGVGIFLAALYKVTGEEAYRDYALSSVKNLCEAINKEKHLYDMMGQMEVGGGFGSASIVYALSKIAELLGEEKLLQDATKAAYAYNEEIAAKDKKYDLLLGSAGAVLSLLKLYELTGDVQVLAKAVIFGEHLLQSRVEGHTGYRAWGAEGHYLLTGISHGAAGIAYALIKLHKFSGDARFLDAGLEAIRYERSVFVAEKNNWPDYRGKYDPENPRVWNSWCNGAPGIGLARVGVYKIRPDDQVLNEIKIALETTKKFPIEYIDHLCCGNMGRVETILAAGMLMNDEQLLKEAARRTAEVIAVAKKRGRYGLNWKEGPYNPAFFQGATGIGYEFLRVADPESLSSVLLWE
ncbi:MAG: type 2 lanthipeptide synthetase LanM family protein [Bacteroidota bacterium]